MPSSTSSGPGQSQRKGRSASGRAQPKGGGDVQGKGAGQQGTGGRRASAKTKNAPKGGSRIGRYTPPEESGRYTPPIPRKIKRSSPWMGALLLALLILGLLTILLNYLSVLPGSVSTWYLIAGLVMFFGGFVLATRYR